MAEITVSAERTSIAGTKYESIPMPQNNMGFERFGLYLGRDILDVFLGKRVTVRCDKEEVEYVVWFWNNQSGAFCHGLYSTPIRKDYHRMLQIALTGKIDQFAERCKRV